MDFNSMRGNGPFTMSATSIFPEAVRSLPSPSPSIAFKSSASSVGNMDDLSTPALGNPSGPSFTLSPPESLATLEDREVSTAGDSFLADLLESSPSSTPVILDKRSSKEKHSLPKITYSRKVNSKGNKRPAEEAEIIDCGNDASLESSSVKRVRVVGLKNLGNTCYNNAVIQVLGHTCALREYFLQRQPPITEESDGSMSSSDSAATLSLHGARPRTRRAARLEEQVIVPTNVNLCDEFSRLIKMMWVDHIPTEVRNGSRARRSRLPLSPVISPHKFATAVATVLPSFHERHEQQDAQEFLRCALERMQDELASEQVEEADTIVQTVFGGILWNKIICQSCSEYTIKPDPFLDLSLVIPEQLPPAIKGDLRSSTLVECLNLFATTEELEGSPPPTSVTASTNGTVRSCLSCGSEAAFSKAIAFGVLPNVLCIHLKRFRWRSHKVRGGKQKVDTHVKFPLEGLDMRPWCEQGINSPILYDLYAVVVHQGTGANFGHYVAYTKHQAEWWLLDDDRITKVSPEAVAKSKAYLLFYKRREDEISPSTITDDDESPVEPTNESCTPALKQSPPDIPDLPSTLIKESGSPPAL
ncbi:cysteine proteinase [Choiromyces venosus 120613-1]|uniref:Cysteine proteinase n=1 Tax=Choiromyces venosus 120613-1 TaxID=1336337 RepID=A0A3N4JUP0_9PEZI|nr:cysteine proteinase [Choiromyces venosus 120613-1]